MAGFAEVVGHEGVIRNLRAAARGHTLPHAMIFNGAAGLGKKTLADALAQTLQCEAGETDACGHCVSCRTFASGNHPDVHYIAAAKTKSIGVDDVRGQIIHRMETKPYRYPYKIFIMDAADTMTPAAQNALLKVIEEPAPYGVFLFLSQNLNAFLPTILSRCAVFKLKPLPTGLVKAKLLSAGIDEDKASFYADYAGGNIGQALAMAGSESFLETRGAAAGMAQDLRRMDLPEVFAQFAVLEKYKDNIQDILDLFALWYRDVIVAKQTGGDAWIIQRDQKNAIYAEARSSGLASLYDKFDAVWQAKRNLKQNGNFQLTLEMLLLRLAR
ncbi:MAG: DNA polymerase III subunit delta' [Clostridiales bacterium]|jgi:DNA polymerase-3 subunit delta'|nr:DNA polymerase III subunit delta' [Clostridiales bacterium]